MDLSQKTILRFWQKIVDIYFREKVKKLGQTLIKILFYFFKNALAFWVRKFLEWAREEMSCFGPASPKHVWKYKLVFTFNP